MKHSLILLLFFVLPCAVSAQEVDQVAYGHQVRYMSDHLFLQRDSDFNVVDYHIEWPEVLGFNRVDALRRCITRVLFQFGSADIDSSLVAFTSRLGRPVTEQLKTLPDDRRFCYFTLKAELKSFSQGRWASYFISAEVKPESLSAEEAYRKTFYVTYDMASDKLMGPETMLAKGIDQNIESRNFYNRLFKPLDADTYNNMLQSYIDGVWFTGNNIAYHVQVLTADETISYEVAMPYEGYNRTLSKKARQLMTGKPVSANPYMQMLPITLDGDTIYNKVENMPVFPGGWENARKLWADFPSVDREELNLFSPRVQLSYVVDKNGRVRDVRVLSPSHPVISRYAASCLKGVSGFAPGMHEGQKVCVRMIIPLRFTTE